MLDGTTALIGNTWSMLNHKIFRRARIKSELYSIIAYLPRPFICFEILNPEFAPSIAYPCHCRLGGVNITKTRLYKVDPLKPHFYIVKLGFTGVYVIFLISAKNIDCVYSLDPPHRGGSNEYPQSMFWAEMRKISEFLSENVHVFGGKIFTIFE